MLCFVTFSGIVPAVVFVQPYLLENTQLAERGALLLRLETNEIQGRLIFMTSQT
jgi:hypothetical protein